MFWDDNRVFRMALVPLPTSGYLRIIPCLSFQWETNTIEQSLLNGETHAA